MDARRYSGRGRSRLVINPFDLVDGYRASISHWDRRWWPSAPRDGSRGPATRASSRSSRQDDLVCLAQGARNHRAARHSALARYKPPANLVVDPNNPDAEYYGIFVDRGRSNPGGTILSLVGRGRLVPLDARVPGRRIPRANEGVLHRHAVDSPSSSFPICDRANAAASKDPHDVTIVRMRGDRRLGEAAFTRTFFVDRP